MVHLIAKERFPYAGSELLPGQEFDEASEKYAEILMALGKAEYMTDDELGSLREKAHALGVKVDGRWAAHRLRAEIDAAKAGRYLRRDLRAED